MIYVITILLENTYIKTTRKYFSKNNTNFEINKWKGNQKMMNNESLHYLQPYIVLLLRNTDLTKGRWILLNIEEKWNLELEMLIQVNIVDKRMVKGGLTYHYIKPTETQIYLTGRH